MKRTTITTALFATLREWVGESTDKRWEISSGPGTPSIRLEHGDRDLYWNFQDRPAEIAGKKLDMLDYEVRSMIKQLSEQPRKEKRESR